MYCQAWLGDKQLCKDHSTGRPIVRMWIGRGKEDWWVNLSKNVYSWDSRMHFCQEVRSLLDWVSKVLIHNAYAPSLFIRVPIPVPHPNPSHCNQSALFYREKFCFRGEQTCHQSRHILPQVINDTENFTWYLARFNEVVKGSIQTPKHWPYESIVSQW